NVPVAETALMECKDKIFNFRWEKGTLKNYPFEISIAVMDTSPLDHPAGLLRVSPEEYEQAFLLWMAEKLDSGADDTDKEAMKRLLTSIPFRFHVLASEDARFFHMANLREVVKSFKLVGRSAIQRIFELEGFRLRKLKSHGPGGCDPAQLAQQFMKELPTTSGEEDVTSETYIKNAFKVLENVLAVDEVKQIILACEREYGKLSPFYSMSQLEALMAKTKDAGQLAWAVDAIKFYVDRKFATSGEMSARNLTGKTTNNRGLLDVMLEKQKMLEHLLHQWLEQQALDAESKAVIRSVSSPGRAAKFFDKNSAWKGSVQPGSQEILDFMRGVIFGPRFDGQLRHLMKSGKTAAELFATEPFQSEILRIEEDVQQHAPEAVAAAAGTARAPAAGTAEEEAGFADMLTSVLTAEELEKDTDSAVEGFLEKADSLVRRYITTVTEVESGSEFVDMLKEKSVWKMSRVGVMYAVQHAGESDSLPHCRTPRFRYEHMRKYFNGILGRNGEGDESFPSNMLFLLL
ncbi:unnamed protein product, partial [Symbiodinium sp. CCMP2592]